MKKNLVYVSCVSMALFFPAISSLAVGSPVLTDAQKEGAITSCQTKLNAVNDAYLALRTHFSSRANALYPGGTPQEWNGLFLNFLKTLKTNPKFPSLGDLYEEYFTRLPIDASNLRNKTGATVEDERFFSSQCGSLGTTLSAEIKSKMNKIDPEIHGFMERYCPATLTSAQIRKLRKDGFLMDKEKTYHLQQDAIAGTDKWLSRVGLAKADFASVRLFTDGGRKYVACDYGGRSDLITIHYSYVDLDRISPVR